MHRWHSMAIAAAFSMLGAMQAVATTPLGEPLEPVIGGVPVAASSPPADPVPAKPQPAAPAGPALATPPSPMSDPAPASPPPAASAAVTPLGAAIAARLAAIEPSLAAREKPDHAAALAFYAGRGHQPLWHEDGRANEAAAKLLAALADAAGSGLDAKDFAAALSSAAETETTRTLDAVAAADVELTLAALRYARHARGGRLEPARLSGYLDRQPPLIDPAHVLAALSTASDPGAYLVGLNPAHPEFHALRKAYLALRDGGMASTVARSDSSAAGKTKRPSSAAQPAGPTARRILANMEQWRWMPEQLGALYVWVNVPEYMVRVVQNGEVIHAERVIVGKVTNQTPIFSHYIQTVTFHPSWGVPDSIKRREIQPALMRSSRILARHNLRIMQDGREVDPDKIDWRSTDIRRFHIVQPPGPGNVLGVVRFNFHNRHNVFMHDTPTKGLFQTGVRTYSHGCVRVQNPLKLASILLGRDRNMSETRVASLGGPATPRNQTLPLAEHVPIHITYFTVRADGAGSLEAYPDIYGHEERIALALEGKLHLVRATPRPAPAAPIGSLAERHTGGAGSGGRPAWAREAFGQGF